MGTFHCHVFTAAATIHLVRGRPISRETDLGTKEHSKTSEQEITSEISDTEAQPPSAPEICDAATVTYWHGHDIQSDMVLFCATFLPPL